MDRGIFLAIPSSSESPARGCQWAKPTASSTRVFYCKLVYTVASIDTQCIDSNLESGRYISRVGWVTAVEGSLSTSLYHGYNRTVGTVGTTASSRLMSTVSPRER